MTAPRPIADVNVLATADAVFWGLPATGIGPFSPRSTAGNFEIGLAGGEAFGSPVVMAVLGAIVDAGGATQQPVSDGGGGELIATVKDTAGNIIGLLQVRAGGWARATHRTPIVARRPPGTSGGTEQ